MFERNCCHEGRVRELPPRRDVSDRRNYNDVKHKTNHDGAEDDPRESTRTKFGARFLGGFGLRIGSSGLRIGGISARRYLFQAGCRAGQRLAGNRTGAIFGHSGNFVTKEQ